MSILNPNKQQDYKEILNAREKPLVFQVMHDGDISIGEMGYVISHMRPAVEMAQGQQQVAAAAVTEAVSKPLQETPEYAVPAQPVAPQTEQTYQTPVNVAADSTGVSNNPELYTEALQKVHAAHDNQGVQANA